MPKIKPASLVALIASQTANLATFLGVPGTVIVSAVLGFITLSFGRAAAFVLTPRAQAAGEVFLFTLWTLVGLATLARFSRPIATRRVTQLNYGLAIEQIVPSFQHESQYPLQFYINMKTSAENR